VNLEQETARKWKIAGVVLGVTVFLLVLLKLTAPDRTPQLQAIQPVRIAVYRVQAETLSPQLEVTGRLQPANRALMRFELPGQLAERAVQPGQEVAAGDLLLRLSDGDFKDALVDARAQLAMQVAAVKRDKTLLDIARRDRELQKREVARLEKLGLESLVSASRLDQARQQLLALESSEAQLAYKVDTAHAQMTISESAVARAQRNLERASLTAPFDGTVNSVALEVGDYVSPNQPAMELIDTRYIDLYAEVSGLTTSALSLGQAVEVSVGTKKRTGKVMALQNDPDPRTFTHALRVRLDGKGLQSGELATVTLPLRVLRDVLTVPVSAVLRDEGRDYVFLIEQGKLQRRQIDIAARYLDQVVVQAGLVAGDSIVLRDVAALTDGQAVETGK
jgi:RND family efflux transporter MFP subunit